MRVVYWVNNDRTTTAREFTFPLPPDHDYLESIKPQESVATSISGRRQVVTHARIAMLEQKFSMLPIEFVEDTLRPFFLSHALRGLPFRYYLDVDSPAFAEYELEKREFMPKKNEGTIDRYDIAFVLRRVA